MATDINLTPTAGMPPVTTETSGQQGSTGTEQIVPSNAAIQATQGVQQAAQGVTTAESAVVPAIGQALESKALGQDLLNAQTMAQNDERSQLIAARMPAIKDAEKQAKEAEDRYANHQFYDYFSSKPAGDRLTAKIAIALQAGVNTYMGIAGNDLAEKLQHDVDRDFDKQKIMLHSKENIAQWKRAGVTDLYGHLQSELAALDVKHAKTLEAVKNKAESMALRAGIPEAQAKQNVVVAKMDEAAAEKRLEAAQRYEKHKSSKGETSASTQTTTAKGSGGGVEADKNAMFFDILNENGKKLAGKMPNLSDDEIEQINRVAKLENFDAKNQTLSALAASAGVDIEKGISPAAKAYLADLQNYSQALGRLESGAAIGLEEKLDFKNKALPRVSDSKADRQMRADKLTKDLELRGRHVQRPVNPATGLGAPASTSLPPGAIPGKRKSDGKRGYKLDGVFHVTE